MPKFPKDVIQRAYDVGFSDKELHEAERTIPLSAFKERLAAREKAIENAAAYDEDELQDNIVETDMTGRPEPIPRATTPAQFQGEVDTVTQQRFEALCLLKGWDSGEKMQEIMEGILGDAGF